MQTGGTVHGEPHGLGITSRLTHPDVLQVEGKVPDEGLDQPLLHPEIFLRLFKGFILQLWEKPSQGRQCSTSQWARRGASCPQAGQQRRVVQILKLILPCWPGSELLIGEGV